MFVDTELGLRQGARRRTFRRLKGMRVKSSLLVSLFAAALSASVTGAPESIEAAWAAFDDGRFLEAAEMAEALGTAEALTLANFSLVNHGYYIAGDDEKQAVFERAMELGEKAVGPWIRTMRWPTCAGVRRWDAIPRPSA